MLDLRKEILNEVTTERKIFLDYDLSGCAGWIDREEEEHNTHNG
jgi:hypothetical protein